MGQLSVIVEIAGSDQEPSYQQHDRVILALGGVSHLAVMWSVGWHQPGTLHSRNCGEQMLFSYLYFILKFHSFVVFEG